MTPYNHTAYAESLSQSLKLLENPSGRKNLFVSPNSDTLYALSLRLSEINYPVLVAVDGNDADFSEGDADTLHRAAQYYFMLLMPAPADDPAAILAVQTLCAENAEQIQGKMRLESGYYLNGLEGLAGDSFTIRSVGPLGDNLFGVVMGFQVVQAVNFMKDGEYWRAT